jgi:hypothetical protein
MLKWFPSQKSLVFEASHLHNAIPRIFDSFPFLEFTRFSMTLGPFSGLFVLEYLSGDMPTYYNIALTIELGMKPANITNSLMKVIGTRSYW